MTKLESILEQVSSLSPLERQQLVHLLSASDFDEDSDEAGVGRRGLVVWTESTRGEDWSAFYPASLRNGGRAHS